MTDIATELLGSFWTEPSYAPYDKPALTDDLLTRFEEQHAVRLPRSMVALLRRQNGGYIDWTFPQDDASPDVDHRMLRGIGPGFPELKQDAWWQNGEDPDAWEPPQPMGLISYDGDGHWDLCLDYRHSPRDEAGFATGPTITVIDCELERDEPVAASFDGYLARLVRATEVDATA